MKEEISPANFCNENKLSCTYTKCFTVSTCTIYITTFFLSSKRCLIYIFIIKKMIFNLQEKEREPGTQRSPWFADYWHPCLNESTVIKDDWCTLNIRLEKEREKVETWR